MVEKGMVVGPNEPPIVPVDKAPTQIPQPPSAVCPTKKPEPHLLGEFPMSCYRCHIYADS